MIESISPNWVVSFFDRVLERHDEDAGQSLSRDKEEEE
jgi:hypothetical protein